MNLYDYNYYKDMTTLTFSFNENEGPEWLTTKVYPTKLEIKVDKEKNIPYLYYEGIVGTSSGVMKIRFPKLDLVLNCVQIKENIRDCVKYNGYKPKIKGCDMVTEFSNINDCPVMFELEKLDSNDYKDLIDKLSVL